MLIVVVGRGFEKSRPFWLWDIGNLLLRGNERSRSGTFIGEIKDRDSKTDEIY